MIRFKDHPKKVNGIGRPRRQQLWILPPLKMLRLHGSSYACSVHLQPLPARAPNAIYFLPFYAPEALMEQ